MDTKILGNKIAMARKEKNMSQAQLAQLIYISPQAVGKWERGESVPDILTINQLADILDVDLNYFSENYPSQNERAGLKSIGPIENSAPFDQADIPEQLNTFKGSNLSQTDFAGVTAHHTKFVANSLSGSDFSGADLTGSLFKTSDVRDSNFEETNLTDCSFSTLDLAGSDFNKAILIRTEFNRIGLGKVKFTDLTMKDVKLRMIDLKDTVFQKCTFDGVHFKYCDIREMSLEDLTFIGVRFDRVSLEGVTFKDSILNNVSFIPSFSLTNKYYRAIKTIHFDNVKMDKLTFASLKGLGADLSEVTII
ncbi:MULTISPECIES: pentapeptide repeat-containing protein [Chryseobacterium]|uniref:pentapeptide repeat-containing protein n=1 Tax=Chryseobacterium TaxID=59732 RepID=UPI00192DCDD3|nr:pentapeptide repeat-containing protein [Chryseobacterium cucumeris]QRA41435.1 pentapeptide repeat-containing protein [Chryseobacterium cucumeris]